MVNHVMGSWYVDSRYRFLLRHLSRVGLPDREFDGVSRVLSRFDSFNGNDFTFGKPPSRSAKPHISDGAASSSGVEVIRHFLLWWLLWWCQRQVAGVGVKLRGFFSLVCNLLLGWCSCVQRIALCCLFSFVRSVCTWLVL